MVNNMPRKTPIWVGIDMGATHTRICIMNTFNKVLLTEKKKTRDIIGNNFLLGIQEFCFSSSQDYDVKRIVIGLPAAISKNRQQVLSVPNLSVSQDDLEKLVPYLSHHFNCNVLLERDVNLQLIYDVSYFKLKDKLVLGLYLGTGMGFSIWNEGEIFLGAHGVAGELGHIPYGDDDLRCGCGNYGCLETNCSGVALKRWYDSSEKSYKIDANDKTSGIKIIKYDIGNIIGGNISDVYFNSNGIQVKDNVIQLDNDVSYITVYVEDNAGNRQILNFEV